MKIDLHMHSVASDGELTPQELVDWAIEKGMKGIAVTDHEVVEGSKAAIEYAEGKDLEVISGIEIGADDEEFGIYDVHIVGLGLDLENEKLVGLSRELMREREVQKREMIRKLNDLGYDITFEELKKEVPDVNYGRPHIARILVRKYDEFEKIDDVFRELLGAHGIASVRQKKKTIKKTIDIIHEAGGIAVLAHPLLCCDFEKVVDRFVECGGDGVECDYCYGNRRDLGENIEDMIEKVRGIVRKKGLIVSGGGDFHNRSDPHEIGDYGVSEEEFLEIKRYWEKKFG